MSIKEIKEAMAHGKVCFGIRQALKKPKPKKVFVVADCREETINKLESAKLKIEKIKKKSEVAKELGLNFESEVFSIR